MIMKTRKQLKSQTDVYFATMLKQKTYHFSSIMRTIKFRAWDIQNKKMRFDNILHHGFDCDFLIWMQFTGLKDKNGKEIYCSDLVKYDDRVFEVAWNQKELAYICELRSKNWSPKMSCNLEKSEIIGNIYEKAQELKNDRGDDSGKYENKELLK